MMLLPQGSLINCFAMKVRPLSGAFVFAVGLCLLLVLLVSAFHPLPAQAPAAAPQVPDWALPGSPTHKQVPPPADFHRASRNSAIPIGVFDGQSDVGGALVPGSSSYDAATGQYTINSAGYNIWYQRDELRFLWKKVSGDFSIAADVTFPDANGFGDRAAVLMFRQSLDDDSKVVMVGQHSRNHSYTHLGIRPEKGAMMTNTYRLVDAPGNTKRIGLEKHGDSFTIFVGVDGEPMHPAAPPVTIHFDEPFYVGIGFCSHLPATVDTAVFSNLVLENAVGKVH
jgi:hypothetical protein